MSKSIESSQGSPGRKRKSRKRPSQSGKAEAPRSSTSTSKSGASSVPIERTAGDDNSLKAKAVSPQDLAPPVETTDAGVRVEKSAKPTEPLSQTQQQVTSSSASPTGTDAKMAEIPAGRTSHNLRLAPPVEELSSAEGPLLLAFPDGTSLYTTDSVPRRQAVPPPVIDPKWTDVFPKIPCAIIRFTSVGLVVVAVVALTLALWTAKGHVQPREPFCETEDCLLHSQLLRESGRKGLDPCEDFAAYVCSAWTPREEYGAYYASTIDEGRILASSELRATLLLGSQKLPVGKKPLAMYESCMGRAQEYGANVTLFRDFLKACKLAWPGSSPYKHVSPLDILVTLAVKWQVPVLFHVKTFRRPLDQKWLVSISPGQYLRASLIQHLYVKKSGIHTDYVALFRDQLSEDGRSSINDTVINDTLRVELHILELLHSALVPPFGQSALVQVSQMELYTPTVSSNEWLRVLRVSLSGRPELQSDDLVWLSDTEFLEKVGKVLEKYRNAPHRLLSFISWSLVQLAASITDYKLLNYRFGDDSIVRIYRPLYCASTVEAAYPLLVAALHSVARFSPEKRAFIDEAFKNLTLAAGDLANKSLWLDDASRRLAAQKVSSIRLRAWLPAMYLRDDDELERLYADFPEKESSLAAYWFVSMHATAANDELRKAADDSGLETSFMRPYMILSEPFGSVDVAVGVLNRPLYYAKGTKSMLYGGFGFSVALELLRSLDSKGIQWHPNGTYGRPFISSASTEAFAERDRCLSTGGVDAAESVFPEIPALEVAYAAYRASLRNDSAHQGIAADMTGDVVFLMTACYTTCTHVFPSDPPNPYAVDCNKAMRNFRPFAKVFNCPPGSRMNPDKKCPFFTN
ncbi:endothelin-converting enzyme 2-like [Haemaphysalis longicornis]